MARAVDSPLVRGGLTIGAGIVTGNVLGFFRIALTAYLLGTHSLADSLAVAMGPIDTLNQVLTNTMIFAFVPLMTARHGGERTALFRQLQRVFTRLFLAQTIIAAVFAPWIIRVLAPGLDPAFFETAVGLLRIGSISSMLLGIAAIHSALLYTDRRFAPSAFYQATLNTFTIAGALLLWPVAGVMGFIIGYTIGAAAQLGVVWWASRSSIAPQGDAISSLPWRSLLIRPGPILVYSAFIALNITVTRAYATEVGPGTAAAFEYCMRCVGVPLAFLVSPMSNSLLPEIARLRASSRLKAAFHLIDRTILLAGLASVSACLVGIAVRKPVIALLFQRGSFSAESTELVASVFLGFAPALIGWSLLDITSRSLFALDRSWLPSCASVLPVVVNAVILAVFRSDEPNRLAMGTSLGFLAGFAVLFAVMVVRRRRWSTEEATAAG